MARLVPIHLCKSVISQRTETKNDVLRATSGGGCPYGGVMFKQQQQQKILQTHFSVDMDEYFQTSANFTGSNNLCLENYIAVYPLF